MKRFSFVTFLMLLSVIAFGQKTVDFAVYLNGAVPMGDLGAGDRIKNYDTRDYAMLSEEGRQGYAEYGGGLGLDVTFHLPKGFGILAGCDYFANLNKSEIKDCFDDWKDEIEETPGASYSYKLPVVMNIPLYIGVNYTANRDKNFTFYAEAATGPNFRLISDFKEEYKYDDNLMDDVTETVDYKSATTFAFKFGAGVLMWNRMSVVLDYYSLGSAKVEGTGTTKIGAVANDEPFKGKKNLKSSELVLRVGYHF
jgi:hypothetical protein